MEAGFVHVPIAASQEQGWVGTCALMHLHVPVATVRKINGLSKRHYICKMTLLLAKETAETLGTREVHRKMGWRQKDSKCGPLGILCIPQSPGNGLRWSCLLQMLGFSSAENLHQRLAIHWETRQGLQLQFQPELFSIGENEPKTNVEFVFLLISSRSTQFHLGFTSLPNNKILFFFSFIYSRFFHGIVSVLTSSKWEKEKEIEKIYEENPFSYFFYWTWEKKGRGKSHFRSWRSIIHFWV